MIPIDRTNRATRILSVLLWLLVAAAIVQAVAQSNRWHPYDNIASGFLAVGGIVFVTAIWFRPCSPGRDIRVMRLNVLVSVAAIGGVMAGHFEPRLNGWTVWDVVNIVSLWVLFWVARRVVGPAVPPDCIVVDRAEYRALVLEHLRHRAGAGVISEQVRRPRG